MRRGQSGFGRCPGPSLEPRLGRRKRQGVALIESTRRRGKNASIINRGIGQRARCEAYSTAGGKLRAGRFLLSLFLVVVGRRRALREQQTNKRGQGQDPVPASAAELYCLHTIHIRMRPEWRSDGPVSRAQGSIISPRSESSQAKPDGRRRCSRLQRAHRLGSVPRGSLGGNLAGWGKAENGCGSSRLSPAYSGIGTRWTFKVMAAKL